MNPKITIGRSVLFLILEKSQRRIQLNQTFREKIDFIHLNSKF